MSLLTLQMPALPDPVKVVLQPATTALLVFDMIDRICKNQPNCTGVMVPALASLLARARKAGVFVLYSTREPESSKWMPQVAPASGDPIVKSVGQDRFYNTDLDSHLRRRGIDTIVLGGIATAIGVDSTARGAHERGYQQVFVEDAMSDLHADTHESTCRYIFPRIGRIRSTQQVLAALA